jgi:hypothetical protein
MISRLCMLAVVMVQFACVGFSLEKVTEAHPQGAKFDVDVRLEPMRRGYYIARVSIANKSGAAVAVDRSMFAMTAPDPVSFVQANRVGLGRQAFRIAPSITAGGYVDGEIYFGIRGVTLWWFPVSLFWTPRPTVPVTFKVGLPDGEHSFDFIVD